jgi:hypothetical protein
MTKDIDQEIARLLKIKEEVDKVNNLRKTVDKLEVFSQLMYDYFKDKNLLQSDTLYHIVDHEVGQYIKGFRG